MIDGQAEVLGVYGLPPTISAQGEIGKVLSEQLAREAKGVREMSAATSLLLAERRAAEVAAAREMMREVRDAREARFGGADESAFSPLSPLSPGAGDTAEMVGGGHPSARALMAMMQSVVMSREESYEDVAALSRHLAAHYPERCLWGSNWPHPNQHPAPSSADLLSLLPSWLSRADDLQRILVDNPAALYGFGA
jgi:hypothetical protein